MNKFLSIRLEGPNIGRLANIVTNDELTIFQIKESFNVEDCKLTVFSKTVWSKHQIELIQLMSDILEFYPLHRFEMEVDGSSPLIDEFFGFLDMYTPDHLIVSPTMTGTPEGKKWYLDKKFSLDLLDELEIIPVIKFEVNRSADFIEIGRFCTEYKIPRYVVWIHPMQLYRDGEGKLEKKNEWIWLHCLQNRYNYWMKL